MQAPTGFYPRQPKPYQCLNKRNVSNSRHKLGRNQEYQFLSSSAVFVRLLDRMLRVPPVVNQFEIKVPAEQWLGRGVTEVVTDVTASLLSSDFEGQRRLDEKAMTQFSVRAACHTPALSAVRAIDSGGHSHLAEAQSPTCLIPPVLSVPTP
jgi:hypothetical protein